METDARPVQLAGQVYKITTPLMLGTLIDLRVAQVSPSTGDPQDDMRRNYERSIAIIACGLKDDHPEMDAAKLRAMRITDEELSLAWREILRISGLEIRDPESGEAPAAAG
jgi:hypothetical protein